MFVGFLSAFCLHLVGFSDIDPHRCKGPMVHVYAQILSLRAPGLQCSTRDKCFPVPLPPALLLAAAVGEVLKWEGFSFCSVTFLSLTT